jgi:hypothetical protein
LILNVYQIQSVARLSCIFSNEISGAQVDPHSVTLTITDPLGNQTTPVVVRDGVGAYHFDLGITEIGTYSYRWQGLGGAVAASPTGYLIGALS